MFRYPNLFSYGTTEAQSVKPPKHLCQVEYCLLRGSKAAISRRVLSQPVPSLQCGPWELELPHCLSQGSMELRRSLFFAPRRMTCDQKEGVWDRNSEKRVSTGFYQVSQFTTSPSTLNKEVSVKYTVGAISSVFISEGLPGHKTHPEFTCCFWLCMLL